MSTATASGERVDPGLRNLIWILVLGALAPALDTTIINVGLATLGRALHTSVATSQWVITGYLLAAAVAMPVTGWAAERFGGKRVWLFSLTLFLAGSVLSGAAWDVSSLIAFRLVQGAAAGLMLPVATTLLVHAAGPKRLGRLMAIAMLPMVVVPIFGPVAGGLIIANLNWRWIFYVNVPICLAALVLAWRGVPPSAPSQGRPLLDVRGLALLSPGLALIIYGLSRVTGRSGFANTEVVIPLAIGLVLVAAFAGHALRTGNGSLINVRVLRVRSYAASACVLLLAGLSLYGPLLLLALYYQEVQAKGALATGLLLVPQGVGSFLPRTIAGKLTDRIGPRLVVVAGLVLTALGTLAFTQAGPATNEWLLAGSLFVRGAGLAAATVAVVAGAFQGIPPGEVPDASSTIRIVQQLGGSFGSAVLAVILAHELLGHSAVRAARGQAFGIAFWWAIGFCVLALFPALVLPTATKWKRPNGPTPP